MVDVNSDAPDPARVDLGFVQMRRRMSQPFGDPRLCRQKYEPSPSCTAHSMVSEFAYTPVG